MMGNVALVEQVADKLPQRLWWNIIIIDGMAYKYINIPAAGFPTPIASHDSDFSRG
jgi:hypothetical protein